MPRHAESGALLLLFERAHIPVIPFAWRCLGVSNALGHGNRRVLSSVHRLHATTGVKGMLKIQFTVKGVPYVL
jgi:hypothetical protein